jgi:hypothetical protein
MPSDVYTAPPPRGVRAARQARYRLGARRDTWPCLHALHLLDHVPPEPRPATARRVWEWASRASGASEPDHDVLAWLVLTLGERASVSAPTGRWLESLRMGVGPTLDSSVEPELLPDVEQPVVLAQKPKPVIRLKGIIRSIKPGRRDLALSDQEWESMGLEDTTDDEH